MLNQRKPRPAPISAPQKTILARSRHVRNEQVLGKIHVTGEAAENTQTAADHHRWHDRQTVEAVGQVDRVARADDDEVAQHDKTNPEWNLDVLQQRQNQRGFDRCLRSHIKEDRGAEAKDRLPEILPTAWQAAGVLLDHLAIVIDPTDRAKQQGHRQHHPDVAIGQIGPEQGADADGAEDQRTTHGRRAGFGQVRLRTVGTHGLANLAHLQRTDQPRPHPQRQHQRGEDAENSTQRQVLKDREAFVELLQILGEQQQHQCFSMDGPASASTTLSIAALREPLIRMVVPLPCSARRLSIRLAWSAKCRAPEPNA